MGRAPYSSEVRQPGRTTPALCDRGHAKQPGQAAAALGLAHVLHPEGGRWWQARVNSLLTVDRLPAWGS